MEEANPPVDAAPAARAGGGWEPLLDLFIFHAFLFREFHHR